MIWQRFESCAKSFEWAPSLLLVTCDDHTARQSRQFLIDSGNDDDRRHNAAEQSHHALQHRLGPEWKQRLRSAHACGLATAEDDASGGMS